MAVKKLIASTLRSLALVKIRKIVEDLRKELLTARMSVARDKSNAQNIRRLRHNIACALTVANQKVKSEQRSAYAGKTFKPLDQRAKKTRAMRRALSAADRNRKTVRQQKREQNFPKRIFAVRA